MYNKELVIKNSQFADSVIVELLVRKYCDHLPACRQRMIRQRDHGLIVNDDQLIRSILKAGELLQPLARAIGEELKSSPAGRTFISEKLTTCLRFTFSLVPCRTYPVV